MRRSVDSNYDRPVVKLHGMLKRSELQVELASV
jgi:hypothetical protein